jgi:predicted short-subunit dehydrogenase-like oxidoreductase (DUF2520 family)
MKMDDDIFWPDVNLIVESESAMIHEFAEMLGGNCHRLSNEERQKAHLVAVVLNNFVNHLVHMADLLCEEAHIERSLFDDLLESTISKVEEKPAFDVQTGPAKRGDRKIVSRHLDILEGHSDLKGIYQLISSSIMQRHNGEEL